MPNCRQDTLQAICSRRLKRFEKKVKLMTKLQNYYTGFMQTLPPLRFYNRTPPVNHMQVSCPSSRSLLLNVHSPLQNKTSLSNIITHKKYERMKNRNKRRKLAVSNTCNQVSTIRFFGDKQIVEIENISTRFSETSQYPNGPLPFGQMGDFLPQDASSNLLPQASPQEQEQNSSLELEPLLFTPVCTSIISAEQSQLLKLRFSGIDDEMDGPYKKIVKNKEGKVKRAKQLKVVQEKLQQDQHRQTLEFHPDLDKNWLVINRQLCDYKGKMTTLKRTIQYIHDEDIIIHQSLERSFQHRKLQDTAQEISDFVKTLKPLEKEIVNKSLQPKVVVFPSQFPPNTFTMAPAQIHQERIAEICQPNEVRAKLITNYDRINILKPSTISNDVTKDKLQVQARKKSTTNSYNYNQNTSSIDDLWFARNYNFCESLEKKNKPFYSFENRSGRQKLIPRFARHFLRGFFLSDKKCRRRNRHQKNAPSVTKTCKTPRKLVII